MSREFRFEDPGEGIHEGEITEVLVSVGDEVSEGDDLLVVETDKATTELPSPYSGTVEEIRVSQGDVVEVGDVMVTFSGGESQAGEAEEEEKAEAKRRKPSGDQEEPAAERSEKAEKRRGSGGGKAAAVGELPEAEQPEPEADRAEGPSEREKHRRREEGPIPASPATRRLARQLGVDLARVEPSGPHGRVTRSDVEAAAEEKPPEKERREKQPRRERAAEARPAPELPDFERWGPVERVPLRGVRRSSARRLTTAWQQIPHVTHHDLADVTDLERWRREQNDKTEHQEGKISLMVLVIKAVAATLKRYPRFNASLDVEQQEVILKHHYHIGLAIDTDDGLIVGVLRDVDRKSIRQLAADTEDVVDRVRRRDVTRDELQGATFTVTNVGPLGGTSFTPLINYPEVGILGMARARLAQVVTGDLDQPQTDVRLMLPLSLSFDHRVNDGADAARFVSDLSEVLADPDALLLNV